MQTTKSTIANKPVSYAFMFCNGPSTKTQYPRRLKLFCCRLYSFWYRCKLVEVHQALSPLNLCYLVCHVVRVGYCCSPSIQMKLIVIWSQLTYRFLFEASQILDPQVNFPLVFATGSYMLQPLSCRLQTLLDKT